MKNMIKAIKSMINHLNRINELRISVKIELLETVSIYFTDCLLIFIALKKTIKKNNNNLHNIIKYYYQLIKMLQETL